MRRSGGDAVLSEDPLLRGMVSETEMYEKSSTHTRHIHKFAQICFLRFGLVLAFQERSKQ